jgi:hypothetical protein
MIPGDGPHADLLDFDLFPGLVGLSLALGLLILILAKVHQLHDRGIGLWGHFYQVEEPFLGEAKRLTSGQDAKLFTVGIDHTQLPGVDSLIDASSVLADLCAS